MRVPNRIQLAVLGNLCLGDTTQPSVVLVRCYVSGGSYESLDRSNAEGAERIREVVLYDYVSDEFSTNDMTESDEDYVEAREGTRRTQKPLRRRMMTATMTWTLLTDSCFH